ncbi:hypothetical protein Gotur_002037 [Gossypium turneri]
MSQGGGMDFNLAEEVLAVIPTDPYEQLDLARKITSMAIASRVSKMEGEMGRMRAKMYGKDHIIFELEDKLSTLQQLNQDAIKLSEERDSLAMTAKELSRDFSKKEKKEELLQSFLFKGVHLRMLRIELKLSCHTTQDSCHLQAETVDIGTCDQSVPKAYPDQDDGINDFTSVRSSNGSMDMASTIDEGNWTSLLISLQYVYVYVS